MSFQRILLAVLFGALPLGCAAGTLDTSDDGDEDVGDAEQAMVLNRGIISTNGLEPGLFVKGSAPEYLGALADDTIDAKTPLADTEDGRKVLGYLARCALPATRSFTSVAKDGTEYVFGGYIGLAPDWLWRGIDSAERGWVSACMLAHANAYGITVDIVLSGDHPALQTEPPPGYTAQEAGFYGDIFGAQVLSACVGYSSSGTSLTPPRVCGRTETCGYHIEGACAAVEPVQLCTGGPETYASCQATTASGPVARQQVITVFTQPGAFDLGHTCSHSPSVRGWPLGRTCSAVTERVCASDPYCCETDWDDLCVAAAQ